MKRIIAGCKKNRYLITIDNKLFKDFSSFWPLACGDSAMLITNNCLVPLYFERLCKILIQAGIKIDHIILPDGEHSKSLNTIEKIFTALLTKNHGRDTTIIALGGGVIGDIAGFVAATYQRGVRLIHVPTTLLAQVDSSIGGKTAVNHQLGKNMIGAFYQPASVIINLDCLNTLPRREFTAGLAEVIKYGIVFNASFFSWLELNVDALLMLDQQALRYCVRNCCILKTYIVDFDKYEHGRRLLLNFGHTFGHAIETHMGYGKWLHGEAVAAGMMIAICISRRLGQFNNSDSKRISQLLQRIGLPLCGPIEMDPEDYLSHIMRDKKNIAGFLRLILPLALGNMEIRTNITNNVILASIKDCLDLYS